MRFCPIRKVMVKYNTTGEEIAGFSGSNLFPNGFCHWYNETNNFDIQADLLEVAKVP